MTPTQWTSRAVEGPLPFTRHLLLREAFPRQPGPPKSTTEGTLPRHQLCANHAREGHDFSRADCSDKKGTGLQPPPLPVISTEVRSAATASGETCYFPANGSWGRLVWDGHSCPSPLTLMLILAFDFDCQELHRRQHHRGRAALQRRVKRVFERTRLKPPLTHCHFDRSPERSDGKRRNLLFRAMTTAHARRLVWDGHSCPSPLTLMLTLAF